MSGPKHRLGRVSAGMLGDWCAVEDFCPGSSDGCLADPGWTSGDATSAFYFVKNLEVMVQMANATGRHADVSKYEAALAHARVSYRRAFFNESTEDFGPTQTGNALGILAAPSVEPGAVKTLLANLKSRGGHLSTGKETHPSLMPFSFVCKKRIIVPRHARDKHRESTQNKLAFP